MSGPADPGRARPVVILAEDDLDTRELLAAEIAEDGFDVVAVRDGTELSEQLERCARENRCPAMIVTDHMMPGCYVFDVLGDFAEVLDGPPVIVITAFAELTAAARELGAKAVFHKPFDPDDLRTAVLHWVSKAPDRPVGPPWRTATR